MSSTLKLARLEALQITRSAPLRIVLALAALACVLSLVHGRGVISRQETALRNAGALQAEQHRAVLETQPAEALAGDQLYYLFFHTAHEPSPWAAFSLGQRDIQPFNLKVRLLALQGQLHEADLVSPLLALYGNFDAAFVLVVLAPLFLIAFTYDVLSGEVEGGTWDLARAQGVGPTRLALLKLAVRGGIAASPVVLLLATAPLVMGAAFDGRLVAISAGALAYVVFWLLAALFVSSYRRGSQWNLLVLCGLWLGLTVAAPALLHAFVALRVPVGEGAELAVRQRHGYHSGWDRPLAETMDAFYARYPEWKGSEVPTDRYSNAWYYAMQQRGDDAARVPFEEYRKRVAERHALSRSLGVLLPSTALSQALASIARTDVDSHLAYLDSVAAYHEALKRHFHPAIFDNRAIGAMDWGSVPSHDFQDAPPDLAREIAPLLLWIVVLALAVRADRSR